MDHTAYLGHQQRQEVLSCEIICCGQGGGQDPDQSCYSNLAGTCEGLMPKQGSQNQKARAFVSKKAKKPSD